MKLYFKYMKMHLQSVLEYKASFIFSLFAQIAIFFSYYIVILSLFSKFGNIKGFTLYEVLLCFSVIMFGYSFNEFFARGIDSFDKLIIAGKFDRLMLRPRSILLQVLGNDIDFVKASRIVQSVIVLIISIIGLNLDWTPIKIITLLFMLIGAIVIFFGLFLITAAYCFFTIQGLEVRNLFTDGGKQIAQYPIGVFRKGIVWFFTFIIPYGLINYYPLLYILGKTNNILYAFCPLLVFIYLIPAFLIFRLGIKRYESTGS